MKNRLFAALIGFSLVSEFVLLSVSEVCGMEAVQNKRYILTRLDSFNLGINERRIIGGKTVYPIDALIRWLENNTKRIK